VTPKSNAGLGFRLYRHRGSWRIARPGSAREASQEERVLWEERRRLRRALVEARDRELFAQHAVRARRYCIEALRSRARLLDAVRDLLVRPIAWGQDRNGLIARVEAALRDSEQAAAAAREALGVHDGRAGDIAEP
jgi:hypothetical protein